MHDDDREGPASLERKRSMAPRSSWKRVMGPAPAIPDGLCRSEESNHGDFPQSRVRVSRRETWTRHRNDSLGSEADEELTQPTCNSARHAQKVRVTQSQETRSSNDPTILGRSNCSCSLVLCDHMIDRRKFPTAISWLTHMLRRETIGTTMKAIVVLLRYDPFHDF